MSTTWFSNTRVTSVLFIVIALSGCAKNKMNYESSSYFRLYISEERYISESCENLEKMYTELLSSSSPREATRKHVGLGPYQHKIARKFEDQLLVDHFSYLEGALRKKCNT